MSPRRTIATLLLSVLVGLSGVVVAASPVAAAEDDVVQNATSVYRLEPAKGRIRVTVDLEVTNRIADGVSEVPCLRDWWGFEFQGTCPQRTRYYVDTTSTFVENEATNLKASVEDSRISMKRGSKGTTYRPVELTFSKIWNGESRRIRLTYTIPGGKPRSDSPTRVTRAYATFCATSHGQDGGTVEIRVPKAFELETWGAKLTSKVSGKERVYRSGTIRDPASWVACVEGANDAGYKKTTIEAPSGSKVVIKAWPEDPAWAKAVGRSVSSGLEGLRDLVGRDMALTKPLQVKQAVTGGEYAGWYDQESQSITVDEDFRQAALVEHELAHVWFNRSTLQDTWLIEGSAEWAARRVSETAPCEQPSGPAVSLAEWTYLTPRASAAERAAVEARYEASCWVVTAVADAAGESRMTEAVGALLDGSDPYAVAAGVQAGGPATGSAAEAGPASWKRWLDAVDEIALRPAGAAPGLATELLLEHGVTTDRELLATRSAVRDAYHELVGSIDWAPPAAIRDPMSRWDFAEARASLDVALVAWTLAGQTDAVLPGVDAREGPVAAAWEGATSTTDLVAAGILARAQLESARDVAIALAVARAPGDIVQAVGLVGASMPSEDVAIAAVRDLDTATAAAVTSSIRRTLAEAADTGRVRIGILVVAILALLVAAFLAWQRARRRVVSAGARAAVAGTTVAGTTVVSSAWARSTDVAAPGSAEAAAPVPWDEARTLPYAPPPTPPAQPPPPPAPPANR